MVRLLFVVAALAGCERASSSASSVGAGSVTVPPPLPGEPPIGADRERMLQAFATNMSQGLYTKSNLLFLLCNTEAGFAVAKQSGDPFSIALMRRMVALFRQGPGMATARCSSQPPQTP